MLSAKFAARIWLFWLLFICILGYNPYPILIFTDNNVKKTNVHRKTMTEGITSLFVTMLLLLSANVSRLANTEVSPIWGLVLSASAKNPICYFASIVVHTEMRIYWQLQGDGVELVVFGSSNIRHLIWQHRLSQVYLQCIAQNHKLILEGFTTCITKGTLYPYNL